LKLAESDFLVSDLYKPAMHLLSGPGKLIRPGLVFAAADMLGQELDYFVDLAAGLELLHTASLVHDDILDKDSLRRGKDAVHVKYGIDQAILAGDALIAQAISLTSIYGQKVIKRASEASLAMCAGEMLDVKSQMPDAPPLDLSSYIKIAELKTATLMGISASIVADYIGNDIRDTLYEVGANLGISFQIRDDIMNYLGLSDKAKKTVKSDIWNKRPSIVSVFQRSGKEDPVKTAIKLNNFYLDRSLELLENIEKRNLFSNYIEFLKI
jgi:geranylgeranyl pyrophosphate synthase